MKKILRISCQHCLVGQIRLKPCVSSGIVADPNLQTDLLLAYHKGSSSCNYFIEKRLVSKVTSFYNTLPRLMLLTFSKANKKIKDTSSGKCKMVKADRNLFARLLVIAQSRQLDMKQVLSYELGPVPWAISTISGTLVKTNKSSLSSILEKDVDPVQSCSNVPVWIFDAMAVVQAISKIPPTFGELSSQGLFYLLNLSRNAKRIDFVGDSYPEVSIKNIERDKRSASGQVVANVTRSSQPYPRQWKKFLSLGTNKSFLLKFFASDWSKQENVDTLRNVEVFISFDIYCNKIFVEDNIVIKAECMELSSNQEEADTKMFPHAQHAADKGFNALVIKSSDTDVEVLACYFQGKINANLFLLTGTKTRSRLIDVSSICQKIGTIICNALPGFHALTGCDTVSAFSGKGKSKAFKNLVQSEHLARALSSLGAEYAISLNLITDIESFVCSFYGSQLSNVNELRYLLFCKSRQVQCHQLPPTRDALIQHIRRANLQTKVWKSPLQRTIIQPSLEQHGWILKDSILSVQWVTQAPASESLLVLLSCSCRTGCVTKRCSCLQQSLPCTEGCKCTDNCQNKTDVNTDFSDDENEEQIVEME